MKQIIKFLNKELKESKLKKESIELVTEINWCMRLLDRTMKEKESFERGKKIAQISNKIDLALQRYMHFTMGVSLENISKLIKLTERAANSN